MNKLTKEQLEKFNHTFSNVGWHPENKRRVLEFLAKEIAISQDELLEKILKNTYDKTFGTYDYDKIADNVLRLKK